MWALPPVRERDSDKEDGDVRRNTTEAPRKTPRAAGGRGFPKAPRWYSDERRHLPAEYADRFRRMIRQAPTEYPHATAEYKTGMLYGCVFMMTHMTVMAIRCVTMEGRVLGMTGGRPGPDTLSRDHDSLQRTHTFLARPRTASSHTTLRRSSAQQMTFATQLVLARHRRHSQSRGRLDAR